MIEHDDASTHLDIIRTLHDVLASSGLEYWLFGGWGVDFLAGEVTRPHADVDLVFSVRDRSRVLHLLEGMGFRRSDLRLEPVIRIGKDGEWLDLEFVRRYGDGRVISPGSRSGWVWPKDSLTGPPGRLADLVCPVVSAWGQLERRRNHCTYARSVLGIPCARSQRHFGSDGWLRQNDLADIQVLLRYLRNGAVSNEARKDKRP